MKTMIFLGAGASAAEGAPIQSNLFKNYFKTRNDNDDYKWYDQQIANIFGNLFGINVKSNNLEDAIFPTFEEVLGLLDIAKIKNQSFKEIENNTMVGNSNQIDSSRDNLVILLAKCLYENLKNNNKYHTMLVRNLIKENLMNDTVFVSTNYDLLIDNALMFANNYHIPNYTINFSDIRNSEIYHEINKDSQILIKLHGSLNWLYCKTCDELLLTPGEKSVVRLTDDIEQSECNMCNSYLQPIIIPPTYYKNMSNFFITSLFKKFDEILREVEHIIFCGYSFPDADLHLKYYFKRAENNRLNNLKITVINNYNGKTDASKDYEKNNYLRFFTSKVNYTEKSFEEFAAAPSEFY